MCEQKFWTNNIGVLFQDKNCGINLIPTKQMSIEQKLNTATRIVLIVFLLLLVINVKAGVIFLILSLSAIVAYYNYQKNKHSKTNKEMKENYTNVSPCKSMSAPSFRVKYNNENIFLEKDKVVVNSPSIYRFCDDAFPLEVNSPNYVSANQKLLGKPNPKTRIPPVMVPPCVDLDYWRANNLVNLSVINSQSQEDGYQSGFQVSTCCSYLNDEYIDPKPVSKRSREFYGKSIIPQKNETTENFEIPLRPNEGGVNMACGYDPSQIYSSNLPSNLSTGKCNRDEKMKEYNKNLFTQIIEPNIFYRNEINEPANANMGISFTQQFEPTSCFLSGNEAYITARDPLIIEPSFHDDDNDENERMNVNVYDIYDPRFSGYGTSYRSYLDKTTGQPRFAYDDVNAIKMPNYVSRSNIDHLPFADSYGPLPDKGAYGNEFNSKIRALANDAFTRNAVEYRTGLQQRLMRKVNSQAWQQRVAPIRTSGQYMSGGMSCR